MDEAVLSGDLKLVQELIQSGQDVNKPCIVLFGEGSLLILAIQCGYTDIALALLAARADVHAKDEGGWTALHWACHMGLNEAVRALIDRGSRVNEGDSRGRTPLRVLLADRCGDKAIAMRLLRAGASCEGLSGRVHGLFRHACNERDLLAVRSLLKNECNVSELIQEDLLYLVRNLSKPEVEDLLHLAFREGSVSAVRTILENGCSVSILSREKQEQLLHLACCKHSVFVVHTLLKNGCSVSILSREEQEELLRHACQEDDVFVVHALLEEGCSVSILPKEEQEELLRHACQEDDVFVVHALLEEGCSVSILPKEEQEELLHHACHEGDVCVAHTLLKIGCRVSILSRGEQEQLFHHACHEDDVVVLHALLEDGCSVSIASTAVEAQEELLHHACCENDMIVVHALLEDGCSVSILSREEQKRLLYYASHEDDVFIVHTLLEDGCSVKILSREEQEKLLHRACLEGDVLVVESLLASGCNMNCAYFIGYTPLMDATEKGHEEVVKKLILAGANLGMQTANGNTALHLAAYSNHIQCGILLAEGGASVRTKNNLSQTPFDLANAEFKEAIKQALSFTTRKALCIIGNAESGKSTLIASLQAESNSFLGKIFNRFRRVNDCRQRTAGIETVPHCSQRYGEVLFFDFAGQHEYHGSHQMFLESLLSKPGVLMTLLLVVKTTEEEGAILHQLHRWLSPVALMATPASPPQVIVIGSFLDKVKSKEEATAKLTRCIEATRKDLETLEFLGSCFLNCRQPQSKGIDQICSFLQDVPIPEFSATHTRYSLAWVLSQIRLSFMAQAVQLQEFSMWVHDNKDNLPRTMPPPEEVCQDLSAAGHALYLPNKEDAPKSWLVLNLPSILHNVYGTLFSQSKEMVNEFGLLHCQYLVELFPHLDLEMVQQLLISLEFCLPVDPSILKVDLSKLTQSSKTSGWLFFPALISAKPPQTTSECLPQQSVYYLCWQLRTAKKHSILARLLQTILFRLAAHFVEKQPNEEGVQQHCCSVWWNGIAWQSTDGVYVTVHIINDRVIQVIGASMVLAEKSSQYLTDIIGDILSTVHRLSPKLAAGAYIVRPSKMPTSPEGFIAPPPKELFPVEGILSSIRDDKEFALSVKDSENYCSIVSIADLFGGYIPSLEDIGRISWPQPKPNQPQSPTGPGQPVPGHSEGNGAATNSQTIPSVAQALLDVSSTPDMRDVDELVVTAVAANWQRVALRLGVEGCVSEVVLRNHPNDCEGACRDMLDRWLRGERHTGEEERTWSILLTALGRADSVELERRLRREHFKAE